jgi:Tol biopolymer transport system component
VLQFDKSRQETAQLLPQFLPDGRHFLFVSGSSSTGKGGIYLGSLDSRETRRLLPVESNATYVPPGFLVYGQQETILAQEFDAAKLQVTGDPVQIVDHAARLLYLPVSSFSVSQNGVLVYANPAVGHVQLAWHNREGKRGVAVGEPGMYRLAELSPDEKRLAVTRTDAKTGKSDVWILEISSGILSRLTLHSAEGMSWSSDGRQLLIGSSQQGKVDLYRKEVGGGEEQLIFRSDEDKYASEWLKDGSVLFENTAGKVFYRQRPSGERKPEVLLQTEFDKDDPRVSPDGRWIAYCSTESGQWEVYVAAFPSFNEKRQVSNSGGCQPVWRRDGKELFYLDLQGKMTSVEVKGGVAIQTGAPKALFQVPFRTQVNESQFDVSGDGKRFLLSLPVGEESKPISVVLNWAAGLKR